MKTRIAAAALVVLAILVVSTFAVYETYYAQQGSQCAPIQGGKLARSHVSSVTFGAVTEYALPGQGRWPNAVATALDGSVWFAEQEVPGVAHLYPNNGTLVEYAWPGYPTPQPPDCLYQASSSGIALWNGRVWAADEFANAVMGLNPADGSTVRINTTRNAAYPYWLAVGPDGNLWFTSDDSPARLGRIYPNMTLSIVNLLGLGADQPIQVDFVNSSLAFLATVNEAENATSKTCICTGHIYSFDPSSSSEDISPTVVGGSYRLVLPTSVSYSDGRIWVAQHGASSIASYDFATGAWTKYPTSRVPWTSTTLPLVVYASGTTVWFNEHYANKLAILDRTAGTLTEISESSPPASSGAGIQNDESFALASGGLWFTSESGNYVGYLDGNYKPEFQVVLSGTNGTVALPPGGSGTVSLMVTGSWTSLNVNASDSENFASAPNLIHLAPGVTTIPAGSSPYKLDVQVSVAQSIAKGIYTVAVTLTEGGVQQSAYFVVDVS
ncbi:MAG: hypothetical protein KGI38_07075 [Thaumarchaeota archaeon]|nr:hypothetical protein [Nitrososphaerota archaeon]